MSSVCTQHPGFYRHHFGEPRPCEAKEQASEERTQVYEDLVKWARALGEAGLDDYHKRLSEDVDSQSPVLMDAQDCLRQAQRGMNVPPQGVAELLVITKAPLELIQKALDKVIGDQCDEILTLALIANPSVEVLELFFEKGARFSAPCSRMLDGMERNEAGLRKIIKVLRELSGFGQSTVFPIEKFSNEQVNFVFDNLAVPLDKVKNESSDEYKKSFDSTLYKMRRKFPDVEQKDYDELSELVPGDGFVMGTESLIAFMGVKVPLELVKKVIEVQKSIVEQGSSSLLGRNNWHCWLNITLTAAICFNPSVELLEYLKGEGAVIEKDFLGKLKEVEESQDGLETAAIRQFANIACLIAKFIPSEVGEETVKYIFNMTRE